MRTGLIFSWCRALMPARSLISPGFTILQSRPLAYQWTAPHVRARIGYARRFRGPLGARLLQRRGGLIVRRLAARLGGRAVFGGLSAILEGERNLPFAAALVQALNLILLTSPEARRSRTRV